MPTVKYGFKDVLVRSQLPPEALRRSLEQQVHALDPRVPLTEVQSMSEYLGDLTAVKRFTSEILACFAGLGLVLAVMGIYGVISFLVAQRTQEIGIRLALGAPRMMVLWLVAAAIDPMRALRTEQRDQHDRSQLPALPALISKTRCL
jgi:ABC-type lipoprotein release transport system permease subunit